MARTRSESDNDDDTRRKSEEEEEDDKEDYEPLDWQEGLERLKDYRAHHGHCLVHLMDDAPLYNWIYELRRNRESLSQKQHQKLTKLGFIWSTKPEMSWCRKLQLAKRGKIPKIPREAATSNAAADANNNNRKKRKISATNSKKAARKEASEVSSSEKEEEEDEKEEEEEDNDNKASKGHKVKSVVVKSKRDMITICSTDDDDDEEFRSPKERKRAAAVKKIRKIDLAAAANRLWQDDKEEVFANKRTRLTWDDRYEELVKYREEHGDTKVPQSYPGLGKWVSKQRDQYRMLVQGKKSSLNTERIQKLSNIDFVWSIAGAVAARVSGKGDGRNSNNNKKKRTSATVEDDEEEEETTTPPEPATPTNVVYRDASTVWKP